MAQQVFMRSVLTILSGFTVLFSLPALAVDYAKLFAELSPSVVTVQTQEYKAGPRGIKVLPGLGSGILIEPTLVLTAAHVVDTADAVRVRFYDDKEIGAEIVSLNDTVDIALLRLAKAPKNPVPAKIGNAEATPIGSPVFTIGAPFGVEHTLSIGHLSGRMNRRKLADGSPVEFLQTDAAINTGNSGGPLFNADGEVIGVISFILTKGGGFDGIGFAVSINIAHSVMMNSTAYLTGLDAMPLTPKLTRILNIPGSGLIVQRVISGSLADKLGLRPGTVPATIGGSDLLLGGDIILSLDDHASEQANGFVDIDDLVDHFSLGRSFNLTILRDGQLVRLSATGDPQDTRSEAPTILAYY